MGSTGHGIYKTSKTGNVGDETFGIANAVIFKGKVPENSGLEPVGQNRITLKVKADDGNNILFQFRLSKDNNMMTIIGYKSGIPEVKAKVAVDSGQPSLADVIKHGSKSQVNNAIKLRDLFQKSTDVKESQLGSIADKLIRNKRKREGEG